MKKNIDSIIFDVDGTLWDSREIVAEAWTKALHDQYSLPITITADILAELFGKTMAEIGQELFAEKDLKGKSPHEVLAVCCSYEEAFLREKGSPTYPNLASVISNLKENYPLYIVSNCQCGYIETFLYCSQMEADFQDFLCFGDTGLEKGENIAAIIKKHELKAPIYVGDTSGDQEAVKIASSLLQMDIPFVHAAYGLGQVPDAAYSIKDPSELLKLLGIAD